jgi:2-keto-4-pentenoate hydratase/2-oxohepta-3-ene-1,7-dioic acid hydratase in catechol pathway
MQTDRTSSMLLSVSEIVFRLSALCRLLPGGLIFTGTPAGVGHRMDPPRHLQGVGRITTRFA